MNDTPTPLTRDEVIELLSAELDGEFDAAAADLGFTPEVARARLEATPGADDDRRALTGAAAMPVPDLDAETQAALIARAMEHAPEDELSTRRKRRWDARRITSLAAMFAAVVLAIGAFASLQNSDDESGDASTVAVADATGDDDDSASGEEVEAGADAPVVSDSDDAADAEAAAPAAPGFDFGDVTDPEALRGRLNEVYAYAAADGLVAPTDETTQQSSAGGALATTPPAARFTVDETCIEDVELDYGLPGPPAYRGAGIFEGEEVSIIVFAVDDGLEAFVLAPDCSVLNTQTIRP